MCPLFSAVSLFYVLHALPLSRISCSFCSSPRIGRASDEELAVGSLFIREFFFIFKASPWGGKDGNFFRRLPPLTLK